MKIKKEISLNIRGLDKLSNDELKIIKDELSCVRNGLCVSALKHSIHKLISKIDETLWKREHIQKEKKEKNEKTI